MKFKTIVGLEIHSQLNSKTKAFCSCVNEYGLEPNTATCPGCLGMPGALPVLNNEVVDLAIMAGLAFNCDINLESTFERKKYFYPDLAKGYQITQGEIPICENGYITVLDENNKDKNIRIQRIQIEEDTGKALHNSDDFAYMDYNRSGAPLVEIITYPDINSSKEAKEFLTKLKNTLQYLDINTGRMEEGSLRCDVNINLVNLETDERTSIIEIKNINSFSAVEKTIEFEIERQKELLLNNEFEVRSTRRWDDSIQETMLMREKFSSDDYKLSYDGDIPTLVIDEDIIEAVRNKMPELIEEKTNRFIKEYELSKYDAEILTSDKKISEFFENSTVNVKNKTLLANFTINELLRRLHEEESSIDNLKFTLEDFSKLLNLVDEDKINNNTAKKVFRVMFEEGIDPIKYVEENNMIQIDDKSEIDEYVNQVLNENPDSIEQYLSGKDRILGFLVGQVMKLSKGKANPQLVNKLILEKIKKSQ